MVKRKDKSDIDQSTTQSRRYLDIVHTDVNKILYLRFFQCGYNTLTLNARLQELNP